MINLKIINKKLFKKLLNIIYLLKYNLLKFYFNNLLKYKYYTFI